VQLATALRKNAGKVLDLFRDWDTDGDGQVHVNVNVNVNVNVIGTRMGMARCSRDELH